MSLLLTLAAGNAWGQSEDGVDVILNKDVVKKTLTMSRGYTLHVGPNTRIRDERGSLITFADLPSATPFAFGHQTVGGETVQYSAREVRGKLVALEIQVLPKTLE